MRTIRNQYCNDRLYQKHKNVLIFTILVECDRYIIYKYINSLIFQPIWTFIQKPKLILFIDNIMSRFNDFSVEKIFEVVFI